MSRSSTPATSVLYMKSLMDCSFWEIIVMHWSALRLAMRARRALATIPTGKTKRASGQYLLVCGISTPRKIILALDREPFTSNRTRRSKSTVEAASLSTATTPEVMEALPMDALFSTGEPVISSPICGGVEFAPSSFEPDGETDSLPH